jgi:hypothetical protein
MQVVHGYCQRSQTALAGVQAVTSCIMPPYFKEAQSEADLAQCAKSFLWGLLVRSDRRAVSYLYLYRRQRVVRSVGTAISPAFSLS